MENITPTTNLNYLFSQRLNFITTKEELILKCQQSSQRSMQSFAQNALNEMQSFNGDLKSDQQIANAYKLLYGFVYHCRFYKKNLQSTSKNSIKGKKMKTNYLNLVNKTKIRSKQFFLEMGLSSESCDAQKQALNLKNISWHLSKVKGYFTNIFERNFQLNKGNAKIKKHLQIENSVKIQLCILIIDIVTLINTMVFMVNPFNQTDFKDKKDIEKTFIDEEIQLFYQTLDQFNQTKKFGNIITLSTKNIKDIYGMINILVEQPSQQQKIFKFWYQIEKIRLKYVVDQNGIIKTKQLILKSNSVKFSIRQFKNQWQNILHKYFKGLQISFSHELQYVFKEFSHVIDSQIQKIMHEQNNKQNKQYFIFHYLILIREILIQVDKKSVQKLYINELLRLNNKFQLSENFIKNEKDQAFKIINTNIKEFSQHLQKDFFNKIKKIRNCFDSKLIKIKRNCNLIKDYFLILHKQLITLIKQKSQTKEKIQKIKKKSQFFEIVQDTQTLLLQKGFNKDLQISQKEQEKIVNYIGSLKGQNQEQNDLINEIKFFFTIIKALTKTQIDEKQLMNAKQFYSNKRLQILSNNNIVNQQNFNKLSYGLISFIRILIYQLILKMRLKIDKQQLDHDQKLIFKLLKAFVQKEKLFNDYKNYDNQTQELQQFENQQQQFEATLIKLKKIKSFEINPQDFILNPIQEDRIVPINQLPKYVLNFQTKIYQLRMEIIRKNIKQSQLKQQPLQDDYIQTKKEIYKNLFKNSNDDTLKKQLENLANIQYLFIKQRYHRAWRLVKRLRHIQTIFDQLEKKNKQCKNLIKIYINIYLLYKDKFYDKRNINGKDDIQQNQIQQLIEEVIKNELQKLSINQQKQLRQDLTSSINYLDKIYKIDILRRQIRQYKLKLTNQQDQKNYKPFQQDNNFQILDGRLEIYLIQKNNDVLMKKYVINCHSAIYKYYEQKLKILKNLNLNNIHVQVKSSQSSQMNIIQMTVNEVQNQFDSMPKLIKYLIQVYTRVISFCSKQLKFKLYPLLKQDDIKIQLQKINNHYILNINPYQGILLNLLLTQDQLKKSGNNYFIFPKHPFVALSDQINKIAKNNSKILINQLQGLKMTNKKQHYEFYHLLEEMKSISMQNSHQNISIVAEKILKCPYFWSSNDQFFELIEFKENYLPMVMNKEEHQRKRTAIYLNTEGIMEKQAFLEDIGNFKTNNLQSTHHNNYDWSCDNNSIYKIKIKNLIKVLASQKDKKATFPTNFQSHIKSLRNVLSHYIYDEKQKKIYLMEDKMFLIEKSFPKLFVFIYRWKPYLHAQLNEIKKWRQTLLQRIFSQEDRNQIINRLSKIKLFKEKNYDIQKLILDYKNNYTKTQLMFPFLFDDLRKSRHQWDIKALGFDKQKNIIIN